MARLSSPIDNIKEHYTVVVVGSGYGGGIAASRMARAGRQVCVLERGKEFQPGEYPDTQMEAVGELQIDLPGTHIGSRTGLYDVRVNEDMNVFLGCGLGGTSLVNANVALRAEPRVFDDPRWPQGVRDDFDTRVEEGYSRAREMLKTTHYPGDYPPLRKLQTLQKSAARMGEKVYSPPINVNFKDGVNHVGVFQQACVGCGDCCSGCNYAAKNTIIMNYLPDARNHGAEIYTQVSVQRIERAEDRWLVHFEVLDANRTRFDAPTMFISADIVILAAGALGSTEILLRSREAGLPVSDKLGHNFTGNGDVLAFSYNSDEAVNGVGFGQRPEDAPAIVGPTITGIIDIRNQENLEDGMVIEEGVIPSPLADSLPKAFALAAPIFGKDTDVGVPDLVRERSRELDSLVRGPYRGAIHNTQTYLVMTHDDSAGRMYLEDDRLRIDWKGVGQQPIFEKVSARLEEATRAIGGIFVKNPTWSKLLKHDLVTVHPLGGCVMGESVEQGVVNHKGQVFAGDGGVHEGLYVSDGSVIPRSLGVNPLLTISALAERSCALLAEDRGWTIDYSLPSRPSEAQVEEAEPAKLGIQFTETMRGYWSTTSTEDYAEAYRQGKEDGSRFEFTLTIISDDLERMIQDPAHAARIVGTVNCPALSPEPLTATDGTFNLFEVDPDEVGVRKMRYRMRLTSEEGKTYYFSGYKVVRDDPGLFDSWGDTTTLYITVFDGDSMDSPALGKGMLKILPLDLAKQLTTMKARNARNAKEQLEANVRFGLLFSGAVYDVYGGVFARSNTFNPEAPPRKKRALRAGTPEVHYFKTEDDVELRLIRYQGGTKGPVMLAPGFGTSTLAFSIDTIETNLPEYLYAHGYDVWLFDYRASADLPAAKTQFTADDIATKDWPAAVAKVREETSADTVQVVGHCVGSLSFLMSQLTGLEGVRSAVSSQLTLHPVSPTINELKAGARTANLVHMIGIDTMSPDFSTESNWIDTAFDKFLRLYPTQERCNSPVCRRILFMYGEVFSHDQLNEATHQAVHEMFGDANLSFFKHVSTIMRLGRAVDSEGNDVYLPHLDRLALPIAFIHGSANAFFLPEGSEKTFKALVEANGPDLYTRHVIPGYAHMDAFIGKNSARDVFPVVLAELEKYN